MASEMNIDASFKLNAVLGVIVRAGGAIGGVLVSLFVSNTMTLNDAGIFFFILSFIYILVSVCKVGLDGTIARKVAIDAGCGRGVNASLISKSVIIISVTTALAILLLYLLMPILQDYYLGDQSIFLLGAGAIWFLSLSGIFSMVLQGVRRSTSSIFILNVSVNLFFLSLLGIIKNTSLEGVILVFTCACGITFILSYTLVANSISREKARTSYKEIFDSCIPLWGVAVMTQIILWFGQFYAGKVSSPENIAHFAIAQRIAMMSSILLVVVNVIIAPRFASFYTSGEINKIKLLATDSINLIFLLSVPVFIVLIVFRESVLSFFGPDYVGASDMLLVLLVGQLINLATGSVGVALTMTRHERELRVSVIFSGVVAIIAVIVLGELFGVMGCAIASVIAVMTQNLTAVYFAKIRLGILFLPSIKRVIDRI